MLFCAALAERPRIEKLRNSTNDTYTIFYDAVLTQRVISQSHWSSSPLTETSHLHASEVKARLMQSELEIQFDRRPRHYCGRTF